MRTGIKASCWPAHCLITIAGDFYKYPSNWTPKTSEVCESQCLGEKNSGVWHGSLSQVRDKTHLFADWFYYVLRKGKKNVFPVESTGIFEGNWILRFPEHQFYVFKKPWRNTTQLIILKEPCLGLQYIFQCQWIVCLWDEWWYFF